MAYQEDFARAEWGADKPARAVDEVQRLCKMRLEEIGAQMAELEEVAKRAAGQRNTLAQEKRLMENILDATKSNEPPRDVVTVAER